MDTFTGPYFENIGNYILTKGGWLRKEPHIKKRVYPNYSEGNPSKLPMVYMHEILIFV